MTQKPLEKNNQFNRKVYLFIFALVFLLYGNSIRNNYALDDNYVTVTTPDKPNNLRIEKGIKGIPKLFTTHYVEDAEQSFEYRPLVLVTFAIEYQFFGSNPHVSHFISILLYAITCMLLFRLLSELLKNYNLIFPLLIVFLFIIHPIHTEVVDNIKCRDELLSFLFGMCSLYYFLKNVETEKRQFIFIGILFLVMGFLCKRTALLFIAIIPLTIYFFTPANLKRILLMGLILGITFFAYNFLRNNLLHHAKGIREFVFIENPLYFEHGILSRIPMAFYTLGYYLKLLIIPYPLSCYYGYNTIPMPGWGSPFFIVSAIFYIAIGVYALIKLPKKSVLCYGMLLYLGCIFPVANTLQPVAGIIGERFVYYTSFGFCITIAYLLLKLFKIEIERDSKLKRHPELVEWQNSKISFKLTLVAILILFSSLTIARNEKWKSFLVILRNDVKHHENSFLLNNFIANILSSQLRNFPNGLEKDALIQEAQNHYKKAAQLLYVGLEQYPTDYFCMTTLGIIYSNSLNDVDAAIPYFKKSLSINPNADITKFNLILSYEKRNLPDSAIILYENMISAGTKYTQVYLNLHELYLKKQNYKQAVVCDEKSIMKIPENSQLYVNLGNALILNKDTLKGIQQFEKAVEIEPNNNNLRARVVAFLKSAGYTEKADKLNNKK